MTLEQARDEIERLQSLLKERRTLDEAILDSVDVGIVTADARGRVTFVNRSARDVLQPAHDPEGADARDLFLLQDGPERLLAHRSERRLSHALFVGEREVELDLVVRRPVETTPEHLQYFFIFHDRTQDKQLEMERRRLERLAAMGTMVAGLAHEIGNPMASLRSIAESLGEELAEANVKLPHVGRMLQVLERVERLVRTLLLFGRPSPPRRAPHRPWTILSEAVSALLPRTRKLGGDLGVEAEPSLPDVLVDDVQLVQVLVIFLNNALDAASSPRGVLLRARRDPPPSDGRTRKSDPPPPPFVRFEIRDDGAGIPPEIMGNIFDPFFTTKPAGLGLGLSIAQQLVVENGSRIELTSAVGGPTTFSVLVPIAGPSVSSIPPRGSSGDDG